MNKAIPSGGNPSPFPNYRTAARAAWVGTGPGQISTEEAATYDNIFYAGLGIALVATLHALFRVPRWVVAGAVWIVGILLAGSLLFASHTVGVGKGWIGAMFSGQQVTSAHAGRFNICISSDQIVFITPKAPDLRPAATKCSPTFSCSGGRMRGL